MNKSPLFNLPKKLFRVLVFPSCNEPGLEIIHSLIKSNKVEVFGGSSGDSTFDPSKQLLSHYVTCPNLKDKNFKSKFRALLKKYRITHVFPSVDALVTEFASWNEKNIHFIVPGVTTARITANKKLLYQAFDGIIPIPQIYLKKIPPFPAFAKPMDGSGNRDGFMINTLKQLEVAQAKNLLITDYLPGEEYTVDAFNDLSGQNIYANSRLRGKIGRSISLGTNTADNRDFLPLIQKICHHLIITGPWFAQFKRAANGKLTLLEINCRIGGSTALTRLAGVNIPLLSLFLYSGYPVTIPKPKPKILLNRILSDHCPNPNISVVIWDLDDTLVRKDGKVDPDSVASLFDFNNRDLTQFLITRKPQAKKLLRKYNLPDRFFTGIYTSNNKSVIIKKIIGKLNVNSARVALINDSVVENLAISQNFPKIQIVTPDTLAFMGKEKLI
jgi:carbamoyl-phosphate synthase large subunit